MGRLIPGQWVVVTKAGQSPNQTVDSVWRVVSNEDGRVILEDEFLSIEEDSVAHLAGFYPPNFYINDTVVSFHPDRRGSFVVHGFHRAPQSGDILVEDPQGDRHFLQHLARRSTLESGEDVEIEMRALWLAYDAATRLVAMHPAEHPLHVTVTSLRHNIREAILNLHP